MANAKPKKAEKKPASKPQVKSEAKETKVTAAPVTCNPSKPLKGFFAKKCDKDENILTIFKTPKIWGALIGEVIGTMLLLVLLLTLGANPAYFILASVCIYAAVVGLSGAHLNPLVTAGMMATRRMSAIRGVLYMLAQLLGAWIGLILVNSFRLGSETSLELPMMDQVTGETFWAVALVEVFGSLIIAFCFARGLKFARKNALGFGVMMGSAITLAMVFGLVVARSFFGMDNSFVFNPVAALMYQILPTAADDFGQLAGMAGLALAAYVVFPIIGGILGFYISEVATRLSAGGYFCEADDCCAAKK